MRTILFLLGLGLSLQAYADIDNAFRQANAVVLYDFAESTGDVIDKSNAIPPYSQVNLRIYSSSASSITRNVDTSAVGASSLLLNAPNLLKSTAAATKITNTCKASGEFSFEVWLENSETVVERAGVDAQDRPHPLRILNLSRPAQSANGTENLYQRNFVFGQFYDGGNLYQTAVRTNGNEPNTAQMGASLVEPLQSTVAQTIVPDPLTGRVNPQLQKIVFTVGPSGIARLYLTDLNGNLFPAQEATRGFGNSTSAANFLANWYNDAYLSIGNTYMTDAEFATELNRENRFATCGPACSNHKNRYWKGKLKLVAIYCRELTRAQVLGANAVNSVIQNINNFPIDLNAQITPQKLKAQEIFTRLTGIKTPITDPRISEMEAYLIAGDEVAAANVATQDARFLNVTVRDFAAKMSNRDQTINTPLNDFTATVIGAVRDNLSAQALLTEDITYVGDPTRAPVASDIANDMLRSNSHYQALETGRYDLNRVLMRSTQMVFNGTRAVPNPAPAGLLTSRQWLAEHAIAGTNRRLIEYAFKEFLCTPIDSVADASGPDSVVGPDIDRFPGGSHTKFTTTCRACHTILDGFRPAYSRWTFGNGFAKHAFTVPAIAADADENAVIGMQVDNNFPNVSAKLNRNADVFPDGRRTVDEKWVNNAVYNSNATTFKFTKTSGTGVKEFGQMIVASPKFARCMADRVFRQVCKRDVNSSDNVSLDEAATQFIAQNYNLRFLFSKVVTSQNCLGGL